MGPVIVIEILVVGLLLFVLAEVVAGFLPKGFRLLTRSFVLLWVGYSLFNTGLVGGWTQPPPQTVATLLEQVRGDQLHWNEFGEPATKWEENNRRNYKKSCQGYAIEQLSELGPAASEAVPELIEIFNEQGDYNSGDGVYQVRSGIAKTLGAIGKAEAIDPMIKLLVKKSLSSDQSKNRAAIRWHDRQYEGSRSYLKRGTGPQGIMMGLMLMPQEHHDFILKSLKNAREKIEQSAQFNAWSKFEIDRGIRFFEADKKTRSRIQRSIQASWYLDEATFEDLEKQQPRSAQSQLEPKRNR